VVTEGGKMTVALLTLLLLAGQLVGEPSLDGKIVREIRIKELRFTKRYVVTRKLVSQVGEPYREGDSVRDHERLDRLGIFSSVDVTPVQEGNGVVVEVRVKETFPYLPIVSLNVTDEAGVSLGPGFRSVNLLGRAISFSFGARFGGATEVQTVLENPWFAGNHASYRIEYNYLDRFNRLDEFQENSMEFNLRLGSYIGQNGRVGGRASFLNVKSDKPGITLSEDNSDRLPGLGAFIGYDSRDLWTNPRRGWWTEFDVLNRGGFLGGNGNYQQFNIDVRRFQPIAERHTLAFFSLTTLQTGTVGVDIPVSEDFHLGGTNTIRGWGLNSSIGKNQFINTAEYRYTLLKPRDFSIKGFTVFLGVLLAGFTDFGIAWDESREFQSENFITGVGFGVRLLIPFVEVLRIDFAYGEPGQGLRSFVGVGTKPVRQRQRVR